MAVPVFANEVVPNTPAETYSIEITDADNNLGLVRLDAFNDNNVRSAVVNLYRPGGSSYTATHEDWDVTVTSITNGYRIAIRPTASWDSREGSTAIAILASDTAGNIEEYDAGGIWFTVEPGEPVPADLRDSVWRWRRRLKRQKCSVVSIQIDDDYSDGPGFVLTALALEIGRKPGLDRIPWRGGSSSTSSGTSDIGNGK